MNDGEGKDEGVARRKIRREFFEGEVTPETHHAFASPDLHEALREFGYWLNEFDSDFATYVRRGGKDFIETCRVDGSWRHVAPGQARAEGHGGNSLRAHLAKAEAARTADK